MVLQAEPGEPVTIDLSIQGRWTANADRTFTCGGANQSSKVLKDDMLIVLERAMSDYPWPYLLDVTNVFAGTSNPSDIFANPQKYPYLCDASGRLQFDLQYCDGAAIHVRPRYRSLLAKQNVNSYLHVVDAHSQLAISTTGYVTVQGLAIEYGWGGIHAYNNSGQGVTNLTVIGNIVRNVLGGIVCYGSNLLLKNNYVDMVGLCNSAGFSKGSFSMTRGQFHDVYLSGQNNVVQNNFLGRTWGGLCVQSLGSNNRVLGNILYRGGSGAVLVEGTGLRVSNNVMLESMIPTWSNIPFDWMAQQYKGLVVYASPAGTTLDHNYVEGVGLVSNQNDENCTWANYAVTGNVFNDKGTYSASIRLRDETLTGGTIDGNAYLGSPSWLATSYGNVNTRLLAAWQAASGQDMRSTVVVASPVFPFASFETRFLNHPMILLNNTPLITEMRAAVKQYYQSSILPLVPAGIGPTL